MEQYSIVGMWLNQRGVSEVCSLIPGDYPNGLFRGNLLHYESSKRIKGGLTDKIGNSIIIGKLDFEEQKLSFKKEYTGKNKSCFNYKFEKRGDLWVGNFYVKKRKEGDALCEISQNRKMKFNWNAININDYIDIESAIKLIGLSN